MINENENVINICSKEELNVVKDRLKDIIDYINSPDYYVQTEKVKGLINNMRAGLELYVSGMSSLLYDKDETVTTPNLFLPILFSMFMYPSFGGNYSSIDNLKQQLDKKDNEIYEIKQ